MARIDIKSSNTGGSVATGVLQLQNGVAMTTTLTAVTDQSNTASPLLLSTTGVQTLSKIQITTADSNYIDAEDNSGNNRFTVGRDPSSQVVNIDFASNPTGGTNMVGGIRTYTDGVNLSQVMSFRKDGNIGVNETSPTAKFQVKGSGSTSATTALLVQNSSGNTNLIVTDDQVVKGYAGASLRFQFGGSSQAGISTRNGALCVGYIDSSFQNGLQISAEGSGKTFIDGWNDGGSLQYDIVVGRQGSRTQFGTDSASVSSAQVAINSTTRGFLPPRMTNAQRSAIASPAEGLQIHNTTNNGVAYYDGTNWGYLSGAKQSITITGATQTIFGGNGNIVALTMQSSTTLTFSNHVVGTYIFQITQGGTGSYTITWPVSVLWSGGTAPTLTTTVGKTDIVTLFHDGTNFYGTYSLNY